MTAAFLGRIIASMILAACGRLLIHFDDAAQAFALERMLAGAFGMLLIGWAFNLIWRAK